MPFRCWAMRDGSRKTHDGWSFVVVFRLLAERWTLVLTFAFLLMTAGVSAQDSVDAPPNVSPPNVAKPNAAELTGTSGLSVEQLERSLSELEQSGEIAVEVKVQAADNYRAAIKNMQSAAASDARLQAIIADTATVAARAEQFKIQRADLKQTKPSLDPKLSLKELEQLLPSTELQLSSLKKAKSDAEAELNARAPRRKEIRERLVAIQEKIADAQTQLRALESSEPTPQSHSLAMRLLSRRTTLEKEKPALEAELSKYDAEESADLVRLRMDLAAANAGHAEKIITLLQDRVHEQREAAAAEAVRTARWEAINAAPALKVYAEQNQALAEKAKSTAASLAKTEHDLTAATAMHEELIRQFAQTKKKVDSVGLTSSVGALLRKQMTTLPDVNARRTKLSERQKQINDIQFEMFELEEQQQELAEVDSTIQTILASASKKTAQDVSLLESAARELTVRKREYLDDLVRSTGKFFDNLIELDMVDRQIIHLESDYEQYIDQRVLWIRSGRPLTEGVQLEASDVWLLQSQRWSDAGRGLVQDAKDHVIIYLFAVAGIVMLWLRGRSLRTLITDIGTTSQKANCRSIAPTIRVLFLTCIVSSALPLVCLFVGWRLRVGVGESDFAVSIGNGFLLTGMLWMAVEWIRQASRHHGIGESHFQWSPVAMRILRREVRLASYIILPIGFVTATLASSDGIHERSDVQRIAFIAGMTVASLIMFRLLRPGGMFHDYFAANQNGLVEKLKYAYPIVGASIPASLGLLAASGYFYTAQTLFWRLLATCIFVTALVVIRSVLYRMLMLRRRELSIQQARQRAAAAQVAALAGTTESSNDTHPVAGIVTENKQADISAHSLQSRRLVSSGMTALAIVGLWMIWIEVLPALSMIGNYPVWGRSGSTAVATETEMAMPMPGMSAGGTTTPSTPVTSSDTDGSSITVADLALAMLLVVVTVVLFRNGPGLLEMSLLQQLPLDASVRYAITTLVSYAIVMAGTIAACSTIGLQWSQIQWLATALTFGLAFGLQEMFANFVAGLIILLERPIRVGDIVTVDEVTGVVSKIRIRATSITNWDRKEYVVPNKEFITGRLLNWTLSDKVNRVVVNVGVAYGSDTDMACQLLLQAAKDHPLVSQEPAPVAVFEGFGDSTLNLSLRTFLPSLDHRLQVIHELHTAIDRAFRKAGLEIAFPQRDLHIRTIAKESGLTLQSETDHATEPIREATREATREAA